MPAARVRRAADDRRGAEAELSFTALHQLLLPVLDEAGRLTRRQRAALLGAFGIGDLDAPDRFLVGLSDWAAGRQLAELGNPIRELVGLGSFLRYWTARKVDAIGV